MLYFAMLLKLQITIAVLSVWKFNSLSYFVHIVFISFVLRMCYLFYLFLLLLLRTHSIVLNSCRGQNTVSLGNVELVQ
jgi:hypothetical protein